MLHASSKAESERHDDASYCTDRVAASAAAARTRRARNLVKAAICQRTKESAVRDSLTSRGTNVNLVVEERSLSVSKYVLAPDVKMATLVVVRVDEPAPLLVEKNVAETPVVWSIA